MKTTAINTFKTLTSQMIDDVVKTRAGLVITKRGKPPAQGVPYVGHTSKPIPGKLASVLVFE